MGIDAFKKAVSAGESESLLHEEIEGKRRLYTALAESVPRGENRLIDDAGHVTIHLRHPEAVLQAIQDLLARLRRVTLAPGQIHTDTATLPARSASPVVAPVAAPWTD